MTIKQELHQRVAALSPSQRASLAQQLDQLGVSERSSQRLVAYVVGRSAEIDTAVLRDDLKAKLPNYMVPTAIVPLVQMPRTANGKVDTNALPEPQPVVTTADAAAPRTPTEEILVQIWKDVLGLGAVGIDDNFFELGGDSILSIQIVSRAREAGLRLAPNQLFEQPTVAELAAVVNVAPEVVATQEVVTGEVPLTPIQTWFFEQDLAAPQHWHQAMLVELPEGVSEDQVEGAIATLWTHHDALRLCFNDRQHIADISDPPALNSIDLTHLNESDQLKAVAHQGTHLHNDLEKVVLPAHPKVTQLKSSMAEIAQTNGGIGTMMSGSGPTVFSLTETLEAAEAVKQEVRSRFNDPDLKVFVAPFTSHGIVTKA